MIIYNHLNWSSFLGVNQFLPQDAILLGDLALRLRSVAIELGLAICLLCLGVSTSSATPVDDPELCPVDASHTALNIRVVTSTRDQQGSAVLVTCHYRKEGGGELTSEVGFNTLCPSAYRIAHPGYALNGRSRSELRISGVVPTAGSNDRDFLRLTIFPNGTTRDLDLNVYALCR